MSGHRHAAAGLLVLALAACTSTPQARATPSPSPAGNCSLKPIPATESGASPAVLSDVSGGPGEYLVGVPGGHLTRFFDPSYSPPRLVGDTLYIAQGPPGGVGDTVVASGPTGCHVIGAGVLTAVSRTNGDAVVSQATKRTLFSSTGKMLRTLPVENQYSYTLDGHLVGAGATGLSVYARDAGVTSISTQPSQVLGVLGPSSLVVEQFGTSKVIDVVTGKSRDLVGHHFFEAAGSPDGKYIAGVDAVSQVPEVLRVSDLRVVPLPQPGPPQSFTWSPDSSEVAISTPFGGALYVVADAHVTDLGLLDILTW